MIITDRVSSTRADNPGIMTLDGTNTYVLREPGGRAVVVDPGPADETHLARVLDLAGEVALTLVTHWHLDHTEAVDRFTELTGAPTRATDPAWCRDAAPLADGEVIDVDGLTIEVVATPGHTADSTSLLLPAEGSLLTGDTMLGRGTTIIAHPDGALGPYLNSLARIRDLITAGRVERLLPAHGPVPDDAAGHVDFYLSHRRERLAQVEAAVAAGHTSAAAVVAHVYADVDKSLWPAAERSVEAQLLYLSERAFGDAPDRG